MEKEFITLEESKDLLIGKVGTLSEMLMRKI